MLAVLIAISWTLRIVAPAMPLDPFRLERDYGRLVSPNDEAAPDSRPVAVATNQPADGPAVNQSDNGGHSIQAGGEASAGSEPADPAWLRRTRFGWEDSRDWEPATDVRPEPVPGLHPLLWSALLVFLVVAMLVWASEEDELASRPAGVARSPQSARGGQPGPDHA